MYFNMCVETIEQMSNKYKNTTNTFCRCILQNVKLVCSIVGRYIISHKSTLPLNKLTSFVTQFVDWLDIYTCICIYIYTYTYICLIIFVVAI